MIVETEQVAVTTRTASLLIRALLPNRLLLASGAAMCLGLTITWAQPAAILTPIAGLGLSEFKAGLVISVELIAIALLPLLLAPFLGRIPCRALGLGGGALLIMADATSLLVQQMELLLVLRLLAGVGGGAVYAVALAALAGVNDPVRRYGQCFSASILYGAALLALLPVAIGPYAAKGLYGALSLLALLLWSAYCRHNRLRQPQPALCWRAWSRGGPLASVQ